MGCPFPRLPCLTRTWYWSLLTRATPGNKGGTHPLHRGEPLPYHLYRQSGRPCGRGGVVTHDTRRLDHVATRFRDVRPSIRRRAPRPTSDHGVRWVSRPSVVTGSNASTERYLESSLALARAPCRNIFAMWFSFAQLLIGSDVPAQAHRIFVHTCRIVTDRLVSVHNGVSSVEPVVK